VVRCHRGIVIGRLHTHSEGSNVVHSSMRYCRIEKGLVRGRSVTQA
jgi:hypothetical protein